MLDVLTLDRTLGLQATQLIYWGGMALVALVAFGVVGTAVGLIFRRGRSVACCPGRRGCATPGRIPRRRAGR